MSIALFFRRCALTLGLVFTFIGLGQAETPVPALSLSPADPAMAAAIRAADVAPTPLPLPIGPIYFPPVPLDEVVLSSVPALARPLGGFLSGDTFRLTFALGEFAGPVNIHIVVNLPDGSQLQLNSQQQFQPFSLPTATPYLSNTLGPVNQDVFSTPVGLIPFGDYDIFVAAVPTDPNPAGFVLATSPSFIWAFSKTFP